MKKLFVLLVCLGMLFGAGQAFGSDGDPILLPGDTGITTVGTIATGVWDAGAVTSTGTITATGVFDVVGAASLTLGSADVTSWILSGMSEVLTVTPSADLVTVTTSTGVVTFDFGTINLATDALDLSDGDIANVGDLDVDTISDNTGAGISIVSAGGTVTVESIVFTGTEVTDATSITSTAFVGALTGNASTATALATTRAIGGSNFDGTAAIDILNVTVADTVDTTCFVGLWESATGAALLPKSDGSLLYNAGTGTLSSTEFSGGGSGLTDVTGTPDWGAVVAKTVAANTITTAGSIYLIITETAGADTTVTSITGATEGDVIILKGRAALDAVITFTDGGTLFLQADFLMNHTNDALVLLCTSAPATFIELSRASNG